MATTPEDDSESASNAIAATQQGERLSEQWVRLERMRSAGQVVVLAMVGVVVLTSLAVGFWPPPTWWWIALSLTILLLIALSVLAYAGPALQYRYASFLIDDTRLEIRRGVLWRIVTTVPRGRVQHTDVTQGPLERSFGVARLILHTAGTQHATVTLDGLEHARAVALRDSLIAESDEDARVG